MQAEIRKDSDKDRIGRKTPECSLTAVLAMIVCVAACNSTAADEPYAGMLEALRAEITAQLPRIDDTTRKSIIDVKDGQARAEVLKKVPQLETFLSGNALDAKLAKIFVLQDATPAGLAAYARPGAPQKKLIDALLADDNLMLQIAVADGALPRLRWE